MKVSIQKLIDNVYPLSVKIDSLRWMQKTGNLVKWDLVKKGIIKEYQTMDMAFFDYGYHSRDDISTERISDDKLEMGFINVFCRNKDNLLLKEWRKQYIQSDFIHIHTDLNYLHSQFAQENAPFKNIFNDLYFFLQGDFKLKKKFWHRKDEPQEVSQVWITVDEEINLRYKRVGSKPNTGTWSESVWQGNYPKLNKASLFLPFAIQKLAEMVVMK